MANNVESYQTSRFVASDMGLQFANFFSIFALQISVLIVEVTIVQYIKGVRGI